MSRFYEIKIKLVGDGLTWEKRKPYQVSGLGVSFHKVLVTCWILCGLDNLEEIRINEPDGSQGYYYTPNQLERYMSTHG